MTSEPVIPLFWAREYVSPRERDLTPIEARVRDIAIAIKTPWNHPDLGALAAVEIAAVIADAGGADILVPIPGADGDLAANHWLATKVGHLVGARVDARVTRATPVQSSRARRMAGGVGLSREEHARSFVANPARVWLIDNVITSGNTMFGAWDAMGRPDGVAGVAYAKAKENQMPRQNPSADWGQMRADEVRDAMTQALTELDTEGDILRRWNKHKATAVIAGDSAESRRLGWLDAMEMTPNFILVLNEEWRGDPYHHGDGDILHAAWDRAAEILANQWWIERAGWESINPAVGYFWVQPRVGAGERRRNGMVENPPWLARAVTANWAKLEKEVPADWLPELGKMKATGYGNKISAEVLQYGCGAYGCVMPTTGDPAVVCKVTQDTTEIDFVRHVLPKVSPAGITAYYATLDLGTVRVQRRPRRIYALWREAASKVGEVGRAAQKRLNDAHAISDHIYGIMATSPDAHAMYLAALTRPSRGAAADLAENLTDLVNAWRAMVADPELHMVGDALLSFLHAGVLVADVHGGNVGHVQREREDLVVITDPGHAVVLPQPWL